MSDSGETILFFVFMSLLIVGLVREVHNFTKIPYTPMLLIIGIIWGVLSDYIGLMGDSASLVSDIDPHLILLVFMPALVYESSASSHWHTFRREFGQVMMLAFPGVVISAFLAGVTILFILDYSDVFSWADALMLGCILAPTDPVAVVSLLKEVRASKNLATLMEGESHLNDGTSLVMFTVLLEIASGEELGADDVVFKFIRLSIGGPILGLAVGIAMAFWLKRVYNDSTLEVLITFFTVYLVFYVAEGTALHVSGMLALVALGLYMSAWGKTSIDLYSEHAVHKFWELMEFIVETLIFLLSGIIIGEKVLVNDNIGYADWLKLLLLFVMVTIIRSIVVFISYPILKKYAYGFSWQEAVILVQGGLRGAVGLTLALVVSREVDHIDTEVRDLVLFHTAGIVLLTNIINSTTIGYLITKLGLAKVSKARKNLLEQVSSSIYNDSVEAIEELRQHKYASFVDWKRVKELASLSSYNQSDSSINTVNGQDPFEVECEIRHRFLCMLKGMYWEEYEKGQCSARTALTLIESVDACLDIEELPMKDWEFLENKKIVTSGKLLIKCKNLPVIGKLFTLIFYNSLVFAYDVACAFIEAHLAVQENIEGVSNEFNKDYLAMMISESKKQTKLCNAFISVHIRDVFSEIYRDIQTKKVTYEILHRQKRQVDEIYKQGIIDQIEHSQMTSKIFFDMNRLNRKSLDSEMPVLEELISKIELFKHLGKEELEDVLDKSEQRIFSKGEHLFRAGDEAEGVFILLRGKVSEFNDIFSYDHTVGSIVGIQNLLSPIDNNLTSSVAASSAYTAYLSKKSFPKYENYPETEEKLWRLASPILIKLDPEPFISILSTMEYEKLKRLLTYCTYVKYEVGDRISVQTGGILISGCVNKIKKEDAEILENASMKRKNKNFKDFLRSSTLKMKKTNALHFFEPDLLNSYYAISESAIVLHLCEELYNAWKNRNNSLAQAIDHIAYKRQTTFNFKSMDSFIQNTVNRLPRMMTKNEFLSFGPGQVSPFPRNLNDSEVSSRRPRASEERKKSSKSDKKDKYLGYSDIEPVISSSEEDRSSES